MKFDKRTWIIIPGADVIARKVEPFMVGPIPVVYRLPQQMARNKLPRLARDDIGACEDSRILSSDFMIV
jgi:hypothetical protein